MLWKGTATFVGDTKRLISGRDSPPTRIPMICHWTLSAPMSCYSPLRSSLHLSCRGQLWCTGSERGASPFITGLFADHPFAHTHPRHLRAHTPDITASQKKGIKEHTSHCGLTRRLCMKTECIKAFWKTVCFPSDSLAMSSPETFLSITQLFHGFQR